MSAALETWAPNLHAVEVVVEEHESLIRSICAFLSENLESETALRALWERDEQSILLELNKDVLDNRARKQRGKQKAQGMSGN